MGLASCDENFETKTSPLSNPQESILQVTDVTFTPSSVTSISLPSLITDDNPINLGTVSVKEGVMPEGMRLKAVVHVAKSADFSDAVSIEAEDMESSNMISVLPSKLQDVYVNKFTRDPNAATLYLRSNLYTVVGDESMASIGNPTSSYFGNYTVAFTPVDEVGVHISNVYYVVVQNLDNSYTEVKCEHSNENVYDDPIFTVTVDALKDEANVRQETKYAFVAEEDLEAFKNGDMSVLLGAGEEANKLVKGGAFFVGSADDGAAKYNITLDMESLAVYTEVEIHFYCYYLLGNNNMKIDDTETYRHYMFYKVDDTTYTYTTFIPNSSSNKSWLNIKVWEREAMNVAAEAKAWGYSGTGLKERPENGSMKQAGGWLGPKVEGWYTMTIKMDEEKDIHTYQFTAIETPIAEYTNIGIIGTINGTNWDTDFELIQCAKAPHNWCLLDFELTADAILKFRANKNWDTKDWGGDGSQKISQTVYTLPAGSSNITVPAGTYDFYLNDITGQWTILKVEKK